MMIPPKRPRGLRVVQLAEFGSGDEAQFGVFGLETLRLILGETASESTVKEQAAEGDDKGLQFDFCHQIAVAEPDAQ